MTKPTIPLPSRTRLRELLKYDPATGVLTWKERASSEFSNEKYAKTWNKRFAGKQAFTYIGSNGYPQGTIGGVSLQAHRVIFKWMTDLEPQQIDHANCNRKDNRWSNLRASSSLLNKKNLRLRSDNTSGVCGVHYSKRDKRWIAQIGEKYQTITLGRFETKEEAIEARKQGEVVFGFSPDHGSKLKNGANHD